jgi:phage terminase small subunit
MPRGGHAKSGPPVFDAGKRHLRHTKERQRHRTKGHAGMPMIVCKPPRHLTRAERAIWRYYAPVLVAEDRLTLKARDVLAKYATALVVVERLKGQTEEPGYRDVVLTQTGEKANPLLLQLRQWVMLCRGYETDLLLNPASAVRAPRPLPPPQDDEDEELDAILQ